MTEDIPRQYTSEDVSRIIRRALELSSAETVNHRELLEMAEELGIAQGKIEDAIELEAAAMEKERVRNDYLKRARARFKAKLLGFAVLNTFLFILDCLTPGGWWFQWPLLGMGIPLIFCFRDAYLATEDRVARAVLRHGRKRNRPLRRHRHADA